MQTTSSITFTNSEQIGTTSFLKLSLISTSCDHHNRTCQEREKHYPGQNCNGYHNDRFY